MTTTTTPHANFLILPRFLPSFAMPANNLSGSEGPKRWRAASLGYLYVCMLPSHIRAIAFYSLADTFKEYFYDFYCYMYICKWARLYKYN